MPNRLATDWVAVAKGEGRVPVLDQLVMIVLIVLNEQVGISVVLITSLCDPTVSKGRLVALTVRASAWMGGIAAEAGPGWSRCILGIVLEEKVVVPALAHRLVCPNTSDGGWKCWWRGMYRMVVVVAIMIRWSYSGRV